MEVNASDENFTVAINDSHFCFHAIHLCICIVSMYLFCIVLSFVLVS